MHDAIFTVHVTRMYEYIWCISKFNFYSINYSILRVASFITNALIVRSEVGDTIPAIHDRSWFLCLPKKISSHTPPSTTHNGRIFFRFYPYRTSCFHYFYSVFYHHTQHNNIKPPVTRSNNCRHTSCFNITLQGVLHISLLHLLYLYVCRIEGEDRMYSWYHLRTFIGCILKSALAW